MLRVLLAFIVVIGAACSRPCDTSDNCKRTCQCVNAQTSARQACTLAFRCDGATQVCESDYDKLSCDDVCNQYAAHDKCGFERCNADIECTKNLTCPILDANGAPTGQSRDCSVPFTCHQDEHLCDVGSTQTDAQLCAGPCAAAAGG